MRNLNKVIFLLILFAAPYVVRAQDDCSCKQFPYMFCKPGGGTYVVCTDNPFNVSSDPARSESPFRCFRAYRDFNTGHWQSTDGTDHYDIQIYDPGWDQSGSLAGNPAYFYQDFAQDEPMGDYFDDWFPPLYWPCDGCPREWTPLEKLWYDNFGSCLGMYVGGRYPTLDTTCCLSLYFQDDPNWWSQQGYNVDSVDEPPLGYANAYFNPNTCVEQCNYGVIYLDVTSGFFNGTYKNKPWLLRSYSLIPGQWSGPDGATVYREYDFTSVWFHEVGHMLGLVHRDDYPNCGTTDPNSFMNAHLPDKTVRNKPSADDCCWLQKLYMPGSHPPCPTDAVKEVAPLDMILNQSEPNPTTGAADITFSIDQAAHVTFEVYDVLGRTVLSLANEQYFNAGNHTVSIGPDQLPSGKYIYSLRADGKVLSKEMTVIK